MAFEVFTRRMVPLVKQPLVTIQSRGTLSINKSAWAMLGSPEAVELLYDRDRNMLGLKAVNPAAEHAYALRSTNNEGSYVVSGRALFKYYEIPTERSVRRPARLDPSGILCIDLNDEGTEVSSNRRKNSGNQTLFAET